MYYTVYKITNLVNNRIYIGAHKTKNIDDGYMGSGKLIRRAINKHGLENFEKEILFIFDNPDEMFSKEAEIVDENFIEEENTYNLKAGGFGGGCPTTLETRQKMSDSHKEYHQNHPERGIEHSKRIKEYNKNNPEYLTELIEKRKQACQTPEYKINMSKMTKERSKNPEWHEKLSKAKYDKWQDAEFKAKMSKIHQGKIWITNGIKRTMISKSDPIPKGWYRGMKIKA